MFQSTPPMREATQCMRCSAALILFQSTPPMREATVLAIKADLTDAVSIHASHAGGDNEE